jgi:Endoplasmic Reticulum Oxidoreductin 1 (ERO1)
MCVEERLLYRIISGLHTSISTQLSEFYGDKNKTYPNWPLFFQKVGDHPERIENLYFAYSVLLRAINRAQKLIQNYNYDTGDLQSDLKAKQYIDKLYDITTKNCDHPFDESEIFSDITKAEVKNKFVTYFHNISRLLDCVECEVCKVYSKLQTYGICKFIS